MKHYFTFNTYYEDTDAGGIIYHANYLKFAERARTEFLHELGMTNKELFQEDGMFVVSRIEIDYKKPAFLEDTLQVATSVEKLGAATLVLDQCITKDGKAICALKVYLAYISRTSLRPIRFGAELKEKMIVYKNKE